MNCSAPADGMSAFTMRCMGVSTERPDDAETGSRVRPGGAASSKQSGAEGMVLSLSGHVVPCASAPVTGQTVGVVLDARTHNAAGESKAPAATSSRWCAGVRKVGRQTEASSRLTCGGCVRNEPTTAGFFPITLREQRANAAAVSRSLRAPTRSVVLSMNGNV